MMFLKQGFNDFPTIAGTNNRNSNTKSYTTFVKLERNQID